MSKDKVIAEMKGIFKEVSYGIDHTLKVLNDAEFIMDGEGIQGNERELISVIAILHDIGAPEAQRKYGSMDAVYQEKEGPYNCEQSLMKRLVLNFEGRARIRCCFFYIATDVYHNDMI